MNIKGVGTNNMINSYNSSKKLQTNETKKVKRDSLEISSAGKNLSKLSAEETFECSNEKLEKIKEAVSSGTYKPNSEQIAKKILEAIKGSES